MIVGVVLQSRCFRGLEITHSFDWADDASRDFGVSASDLPGPNREQKQEDRLDGNGEDGLLEKQRKVEAAATEDSGPGTKLVVATVGQKPGLVLRHDGRSDKGGLSAVKWALKSTG